MKPDALPNSPHFSSGPCAKRPGWSSDVLSGAVLGRSHRSAKGRARLADAIDMSGDLLGLPDDYVLGIVPASDTGAMEMALWSLLGPRGVDVLVWDSFSGGWAGDVTDQLRLPDARVFKADYGQLPDLAATDPARDIVFVWNGTTSGVCVPDGDWIAHDRAGLTICDATTAVFAIPLPWDKLDVVTYSWQKALGSEAAHGVIILSPRAVTRLESHVPDWPVPKIFRLTKNGKLIRGIFSGATINTPSLLCVEDYHDALAWAREQGGIGGLAQRTRANAEVITRWVERSDWVEFLAEREEFRSPTSVCLKITVGWFTALPELEQRAVVKMMADLLEEERVAYDIAAYRDAPPGLRIWAGPTVQTDDIAALLPWLDWAVEKVKIVNRSKEGRNEL
jgi:phosphoserine aminotransferase